MRLVACTIYLNPIPKWLNSLIMYHYVTSYYTLPPLSPPPQQVIRLSPLFPPFGNRVSASKASVLLRAASELDHHRRIVHLRRVNKRPLGRTTARTIEIPLAKMLDSGCTKSNFVQ